MAIPYHTKSNSMTPSSDLSVINSIPDSAIHFANVFSFLRLSKDCRIAGVAKSDLLQFLSLMHSSNMGKPPVCSPLTTVANNLQGRCSKIPNSYIPTRNLLIQRQVYFTNIAGNVNFDGFSRSGRVSFRARSSFKHLMLTSSLLLGQLRSRPMAIQTRPDNCRMAVFPYQQQR
jgi:hypothetical protein